MRPLLWVIGVVIGGLMLVVWPLLLVTTTTPHVLPLLTVKVNPEVPIIAFLGLVVALGLVALAVKKERDGREA